MACKMFNCNKMDDIETLPMAFGKVTKAVKKMQDRELAPYGLTSLHAPFLKVLNRAQAGIPMSELTEIVGVDKAHTSRVVASLEELGFTERVKRDETSARVLIRFTEKGREAGQALSALMHSLRDQLKSRFTEQEHQAILSVAKKCIQMAEQLSENE